MAASNFRKASASQQNFSGQRPSGRSQNIIQYQTADNMNLELATTILNAALE